MYASVEALDGLKRKITVAVPTTIIEEKVNKRLNELSRTAKISGFRTGKIPTNLIRKRFADGLREDIAFKLISSTLQEVLTEKNISSVGILSIHPEKVIENQDFNYTATIEILPEINLINLNENNIIECIECEINDTDVDYTIEKLRKQHQQWHIVERPIVTNDKVVVDFSCYIDDKIFNEGTANNYEIIIGSGNMLGDFEDQLLGLSQGEIKKIEITFPEDYHKKEVSGKKALFHVNIVSVSESNLPPLDDNFAAKFNILTGGVEALKQDIKKQMLRELSLRLSSINREKIYAEFLKNNPVLLPQSLIDEEIKNLKHELYHHIYGNKHTDNEQIPDFKTELFEDRARHRIHLGLLFVEYVKQNQVKADETRVIAMIDKLSSAYENPEAWQAMYSKNKEHYAEVEAMVLDQIVSENISKHAKILKKTVTYKEFMNNIMSNNDTGA